MLVAQNISFRTGDKPLISNFSLSVTSNEMVVCVGRNGAGKSTLLKLLSGFQSPTQGKVLLEGQPLSLYSPEERAKRIACLNQKHSLFVDAPVLEVVSLGRYAYTESNSVRQEYAEEALRELNLEHLKDRQYLSLSGGEQQLVQLSRTLCQLNSPGDHMRYLLLDEHTAHLDWFHQHPIFKLLKKRLSPRLGILATLHDLSLAGQYADRLIWIEQGTIRSEGLPDDVLDRILRYICQQPSLSDTFV